MAAKITGTLNVYKKLNGVIPDARSKFAKEVKQNIVDIIVEKVLSGLSPVKGFNRYKKYSDGYAKYKGRKQPVDLNDTGDMLNSLIAKQKRNGTILLEFRGKEANKLAKIHQYGQGNMPVRPILPMGRQTFKASIIAQIQKMANRAARYAVKRAR